LDGQGHNAYWRQSGGTSFYGLFYGGGGKGDTHGSDPENYTAGSPGIVIVYY